jgi:ASC-1-like (ASCH) protein
MRHKTGFTKETFEKMFSEAGIDNFTVEERGFDLLVNITKSVAQTERLAA